MNITVLGPGCMNCKTLYRRAEEALIGLGVPAVVEKVEDVQQIAMYGILKTPGLVIDGKVVSYGRVPAVDEIRQMILARSTEAAS